MSLPQKFAASPQEDNSSPENARPEPYTIFSSRERRLIVGLLGTAMLISPLTATIYLPLLPLLSTHFRTSAEAINLTITVYIIFQALAPLFLASVSDHSGRRPIYLTTFALYTVASLGLALNESSYAALLALRALQSLGASAVLSVSYGTVADICVPAKRGKMLGPVLAAGNVGTCVGPIVGGWVALESGGFHGAFWALVGFGGLMLAALALLIPETARNVVGNGNVKDSQWNQPLWSIFQQCWHNRSTRKGKQTGNDNHTARNNGDRTTTNTGNPENSLAKTKPTRSLKFTSPLSSIRVIFYPDTSLALWLSASSYALWYCIQTSIPSTFKASPYSFNELQVGLAYLPGSVGVILSMYLAGKVMDRNYKYTAAKIGFTVDKVSGDDLASFPIEQARSRGCAYLLVLSFGVMLGYGWSIERHAPVAIPLILQLFQGFLATWFLQSFGALLVDAFPEMPSTAATAGNITRCALSAVAVAALQPLVNVLGKGWFFSLLGLLNGVGGLAAQTALRRWGMEWRRQRREKKQKRGGLQAQDAIEGGEKIASPRSGREATDTQFQKVCKCVF
jgi:MFS family permease